MIDDVYPVYYDPLYQNDLQVGSMSNSKDKAIDMYLLFKGSVSRKDLMNHFDIATATASRALKEYRLLAPNNMMYSTEKRVYVASRDFTPRYQHDVERVLAILAYGEDTFVLGGDRERVMPKTPLIGPELNSENVFGLTRGFSQGNLVLIQYSSTGEGGDEREVYVHSIFEIGNTWYFRAGEVGESEEITFKTYRFSRLISSEIKLNGVLDVSIKEDTEWMSEVTVTLGPNPKHGRVDALRCDLGLEEHPVKNIYVKEALVGLILSGLRVDSSKEGVLNPNEYQIRLFNREELAAIPSMIIAPGFQEKER